MKYSLLILAGVLSLAGNAHANDEIDSCVSMMESARKPMNHDQAVFACIGEFLDPIREPSSLKPESWRRELAEDLAQARREDQAEHSDFEAPNEKSSARMKDHFEALSEE